MEPGPAGGLAVCARSLQAQQSMQSSSNLKHRMLQNKTRKKKKEKGKRNTTYSCTNIKTSSLRDPAQMARECSRAVGDV